VDIPEYFIYALADFAGMTSASLPLLRVSNSVRMERMPMITAINQIAELKPSVLDATPPP
jgi:hypothetical protein